MRLPRVSLPPGFIVFYGGLFLFCVGLYQIYPPLAPIGAGLIIMLTVTFGNRIP